MGLMMLFRKREIKTTKKPKDVGHVVMLIESLTSYKQEKICFSCFNFIIYY